MEVIINCFDCAHKNSSELGVKGYEMKQTEFTTFSEAFTHMRENPDHYMGITIRKDESDE